LNPAEQLAENKRVDAERVAVEEKMKVRAARFAALAENKISIQPGFKMPKASQVEASPAKAEKVAREKSGRFRVWND
jgi:hypothetical protein